MKKPIIINFVASIFSVLCLVLIGLWSMTVTLNQPVSHIANKAISVDINTFAIVIYTKNSERPVLKISPQTDYYYTNNARDHLIQTITSEAKDISWKRLNLFLKGMVAGRDTLLWTPIGTGTKHASTEYEVSLATNSSVRVARTFSSSDLIAVGQAVTICDECIIADTKKRVYTNTQPQPSSVIVDLANKLQYKVVVAEHRLPSDITSLQVVDRFGKIQATMPVTSSDEVYYEEQWHLVEIKTPFDTKRQASVTQEIQLSYDR